MSPRKIESPTRLWAPAAINQGAAKLYETIDRGPDIDSADESGLKPENVVGEIALEGVTFSYPSRPSVQVVKGLSLKFPAGKTAALVGASGSGESTIVAVLRPHRRCGDD